MDHFKEVNQRFGWKKKWKCPICLFLDRTGPEIMFDDHLVHLVAFLDYKNIHFSQKLKISFLLLDKMDLKKCLMII